jgi:hypothetical protein
MLKQVALAGLVLASASLAGGVAHAEFAHDTICQILQPCDPPAQYSSGPFLAQPVIMDMDQHEMALTCNGSAHGAAGGALGCATFKQGYCIVTMSRDIKETLPELYQVILQHELGHCRGWVHPRF